MLPLDLRIHEMTSLYEGSGALEFESLVDEEQLHRNDNIEVCLFTDGSKIEGRAGLALSIWQNKAEIRALKLGLSPYCTFY